MIFLGFALFVLGPQPTPGADKLVCLLGNDDFQTRQVAQRQLETMGEVALGSLLRGKRSDDLEIRVRATRVSDVIYGMGVREWPWIDSLAGCYPGRDTIISRYLARVDGWGLGPDWPQYREATRLMFRDLADFGVSKARRLELLEHMRIGDVEQKRRMGMP